MLKKLLLLSITVMGFNNLFAQSSLNIKAFVQGYYVDSSHQMVPIIDPLTQPGVFDTIKVELHQDNTGNVTYAEAAIFDVNGNASITVPPSCFGNNYFIVLKHRNSLETWSNQPFQITTNAFYDFTTGISQAYGNNMALIDTVSCIYSGDINQDGFIDSTDVNIVNDSVIAFLYGYYLICDLNGDSVVDSYDINVLDNNLNASSIHTMIPVFTGEKSLINSDSDFIVFPNPAKHFIKLNTEKLKHENVFYIYSESGALAYKKYNFNIEEKINISSFSPGNYILELIDSNHILKKHFIIAK